LLENLSKGFIAVEMMIIANKLGLYTNEGPNAEMQIIFSNVSE